MQFGEWTDLQKCVLKYTVRWRNPGVGGGGHTGEGLAVRGKAEGRHAAAL